MKEVSKIRIQHFVLEDDGTFPNNEYLPVLIYRNAIVTSEKERKSSRMIKRAFRKNGWRNSWRNGIYDYHHYHSNTHEVLGISAGRVTVLLGGSEGKLRRLKKGDVIVIPAGVAHRCMKASEDFVCAGAYPNGNSYDMNYGKKQERPKALKNIRQIEMPEFDPVFGEDGALLKYWK